jgi:HEAT repeat protein
MNWWQRLFGSRNAGRPAKNNSFAKHSADDLIASLKHSNAAIRLKAAVELHRHAGDATVEALITALQDSDPEVRGAAAESLRLICDPRAVPPLALLLETDTEHTPVYNAINALGYIRSPEAIAALVSALDRRKGDLGTLALQLGEARATAAVEPLLRLLQEGTPYQRRHAVTALAKIGDTRALQPLEEALNDSDEGVRERVRSVTESAARRLWCVNCGDWASLAYDPSECGRCGKENVTEMKIPFRFRQ